MDLAAIQQTQWYRSRPPAVQKRIDAYPPSRLYRIKETGHVCPIYSYEEDHAGRCDTCSMLVLRKYNAGVILERRVFGIAFARLEAVEKQKTS